MRQPDDNDDEQAMDLFFDPDIPVQVPPGYVAITSEEYQALVGSFQRMIILAERISAGERLTKSMLLRALGVFDEAMAETMFEKQEQQQQRRKR